MSTQFSPLRQYAVHILTNSLTNLRPPANAITWTKSGMQDAGALGIIVDRQGQYQTELFIVHPETKEIRQHVHPDVDSFEYHLAGDFEFIIEGQVFKNISDGTPLGDKNGLQQVNVSAWHGGLFNGGGAFLSFQHWNNQVPPTSVGDNFVEPEEL